MLLCLCIELREILRILTKRHRDFFSKRTLNSKIYLSLGYLLLLTRKIELLVRFQITQFIRLDSGKTHFIQLTQKNKLNLCHLLSILDKSTAWMSA